MEPKNTENCTNICKLPNCCLSILILTTAKQDGIFIFHGEAEDTGDGHCTGMALCRTGERFAYKAFSLSQHLFFISSFENGALSNLAPSTPFVRLTLTFYFENHTGLNVPSHKEKKTL